ncbi:10159_t:CDS:2 [Rhizophagus irregularis]|nr:10159_t:CDS:2 [Rhizophagus irregularis]
MIFYYLWQDKVDEDRSIDNDCELCCETMKIKFKTLLDETHCCLDLKEKNGCK